MHVGTFGCVGIFKGAVGNVLYDSVPVSYKLLIFCKVGDAQPFFDFDFGFVRVRTFVHLDKVLKVTLVVVDTAEREEPAKAGAEVVNKAAAFVA